MKLRTFGRPLIATLACLFMASAVTSGRAQPIDAREISLSLLEAAVERGDNEEVRLVLADAAFRNEVEISGQTVSLLQAVGAGKELDMEFRRKIWQDAIFESKRQENLPAPVEVVAFRRAALFKVYGQYLDFLQDEYFLFRLATMAGPDRANTTNLQAIATVRTDILRAIEAHPYLRERCPFGTACEGQGRIEALFDEREAFKDGSASKAIDLMLRAASIEENAYRLWAVYQPEDYGRTRAFEASRDSFLEAARLYGQARDLLQSIGSGSTGSDSAVERAVRKADAYRLLAADRASKADAQVMRLGKDFVDPRYPPQPPPPPAPRPEPLLPEPPPAPPPPAPRVFEPPSKASDIAKEEEKAGVYLTEYERECLRKRTAAGTVEDPNSASVDVYYATSRQTEKPDPARDLYFGTRSEPFTGDRVRLNYGTAKVNVPCNRKRGEIDRPDGFLFFRFEVDDRNEHFILDGVTSFNGREDWLEAIDGDVGRSRRKEALLYVHGYNNSFADASYRAAQLHADLLIDGSTVFYSWASRENMLAYGSDRRTVERKEEIEALADIMIALRKSGARRVYVVAHSMGNRLTLAALQRVALRADRPERQFDELVMGSADIEKELFETYWQSASPLVTRTTLYASRRDKAMFATRLLPGAEQRLGDAYPKPMTFARVQTIDTSLVAGAGLGHDDYSGSGLADVRATLWLSLAPNARCILEAHQDGGYWKIRAEGVGDRECSDDAFDDAIQLTRLKGSPSAAQLWIDGRATASPGNTYLARLRALMMKLVGKG